MLSNLLHAALAGLAAVGATSETNAPPSNGLLSCKTLVTAGLGNNVLFPSTPGAGYQASLSSYFSLDVREVKPACVYRPRTTNDVSRAIKVLSKLPSARVAVRGGGHSVWPNNNIADGVTIDLSLLSQTQVHPPTKPNSAPIAAIGAGSRWEPALLEVEKYGLSITAGRVSTVGVAGLTLGGGLSFHSGRHGFTCDGVVNYEVVLADGQVVNSNAKQNPDLFKALKGGSGNFGIVTRFDFAAFPAGKLYGGMSTATWDHRQTIVDSFLRLIDINEQHPADSQIVVFEYDAPTQSKTVSSIAVNVDGATNSTSFELMAAVPWLYDTRKTQMYGEMVVGLSDPGGERDVWFSLCFQNNKLMTDKAIELFENMVAESQGVADTHRLILIFQQLPKHYAQKNPGGNVLGVDKTLAENSILCQVEAYVKTPEAEALFHGKIVDIVAELEDYADSIGAATQWRYLNYADPSQDPLKSYGPENVSFMKRVAAKYDPRGFFQTRVPCGFKISHVE